MAQIGTIKIETASGPVEVPVFEVADVDRDVVRAETASGVGAINLVDPGSSDVPVRVQTNSWGVQGIGQSVGLDARSMFLEDDWEDNAVETRSNADDDVFAHPQSNEAGDMLIGRYRPSWVVTGGSPTASSGQLVLPDNSNGYQYLHVPSDYQYGTARLDVYHRNHSEGRTTLTPSHMYKPDQSANRNHDRGYSTSVDVVDDKYLLRMSDGTRLIESSGMNYGAWVTWRKDVDPYGNWEVFQDGSSWGTTTDHNDFPVNALELSNRTDVQIDMDNLEVY